MSNENLRSKILDAIGTEVSRDLVSEVLDEIESNLDDISNLLDNETLRELSDIEEAYSISSNLYKALY